MHVKRESTPPSVNIKRESEPPPISKCGFSVAPSEHQGEGVTPPANSTPGVGKALDLNKIDMRGKETLKLKYPSDVFVESLAEVAAETLRAAEVKLSPEQQQVLATVQLGQNVFFTGSAGTGKSILLREIIRWCRGPGNRRTAVTASTGIAAINVGGSTLHSWAGIGLGKETGEFLAMKILGKDKYIRQKEQQALKNAGSTGDTVPDNSRVQQPRVVERWQRCDVLVIDESEFSSMSPQALR